ncbi:amidase family protein (plasmid) [Pseudoalteromonas espejiana]
MAVALNFAPIVLGTETDGSITCPASVNGLYAIKTKHGASITPMVLFFQAAKTLLGLWLIP